MTPHTRKLDFFLKLNRARRATKNIPSRGNLDEEEGGIYGIQKFDPVLLIFHVLDLLHFHM